MKVLYVSEKVHRRIKALAIHERRSIGQYLDVETEKQMRMYPPKARNEMYSRVDEPRIIKA